MISGIEFLKKMMLAPLNYEHIANNELTWSILINNISRNDPQPCDYDPEWNGEIPEYQPPTSEYSPENSSPSLQKTPLSPLQYFLM